MKSKSKLAIYSWQWIWCVVIPSLRCHEICFFVSFCVMFFSSSSSTFMPFIITRVSHEKTTNTKMKPFSFLFRQYWHSQTNQPKKQNKWTITFLATFVAAVFLPFCWYSSFSHILQSAHQVETNTFSMIFLMHSIIFQINAVKYEVCNKKFYRQPLSFNTDNKNNNQESTTKKNNNER